MKKLLSLLVFAGLSVQSAGAIDIVVDYTYDSNNFFDTQAKKDAMQAVADRFSRIITSSLAAVAPGGTGSGTSAGWRIGFTHPGNGNSFQVSTAANSAVDPLSANPADIYGFPGLTADTWILYAGGRPLGSSGVGGSATGLNFTSTFNDINGPMHRGFNDNTPGDTVGDLPRWGGSISFDTGRTWHFDLTTIAPFSSSDFYSIALHEVGHALGLGTSWNQWPGAGTSTYTGVKAVTALNADNGSAAASLSLQGGGNNHFKDQTHDSFVFANGTPATVGVVPNGVLQDLLMEPIANFGGQQRRFELTNVDAAALRDLGWETLSGAVPDPSFQPDNTVGKNLLSAIGSNIYNTTAGQTFNLVSKKARTVRAVVGVASDGIDPDEIEVTGSRGNAIFKVTYTSGGANVTAAVVAGTHSTAVLTNVDAPEQINITIKPNKRKIKKTIRRGNRRIIKYRRKRINLTVRSQSVNDVSATDLSLVKVQTR